MQPAFVLEDVRDISCPGNRKTVEFIFANVIFGLKKEKKNSAWKTNYLANPSIGEKSKTTRGFFFLRGKSFENASIISLTLNAIILFFGTAIL